MKTDSLKIGSLTKEQWAIIERTFREKAKKTNFQHYNAITQIAFQNYVDLLHMKRADLKSLHK